MGEHDDGGTGPADASAHGYGKAYWEEVGEEAPGVARLDAWRHYMRGVYRRLLRSWVKEVGRGGGLKTDLFEEAVSPYQLLSEMGAGSVGVDWSLTIARAAHHRLSGVSAGRPPLVVAADLRRLPFQSDAFRFILSGSSLDHFPHKDEIAVCLAELSRVLTRGGVMVITFDNPHNPLVRLRNALPFALLKRAGLVPYYVGATYSRGEARMQFDAAGLVVTEVTAVAHAPRAPAIWAVALAERLGWARLEHLIRSALEGFELLERLPTRYYTGYYLAFRVEKSGPAAGSIPAARGA